MTSMKHTDKTCRECRYCKEYWHGMERGMEGRCFYHLSESVDLNIVRKRGVCSCFEKR